MEAEEEDYVSFEDNNIQNSITGTNSLELNDQDVDLSEVERSMCSIIPEHSFVIQPQYTSQTTEDMEIKQEDGQQDDKEPLNFELQQGFRILKELMADTNKSVNFHFLEAVNDSFPETHDYYERIKSPMWLRKMLEKFNNREYETITSFVADFRLMLENCFRYNGPDHYVSKRAQRLETMMEQKLALLSRDLREKTSITATSGQTLEESFSLSGLRRRTKTIVPHDSSVLLNHLREEEVRQQKEQRRQQIADRKATQEAYISTLQEWEDQLMPDELKTQMKSMWEIPAIGHFLFLCQEPLNLEEVAHYELERCFFMPRQSSTLQRIMSSLLSTPFQRTKLDRRRMMPYYVWEEKLRTRLELWYKVFQDKHCDTYKAAYKLGIDAYFFDVAGKRNPLERKRFHELSLYRKVWILKSICDNCVENQESLRLAIESQEVEEQRGYLLGEDSKGNSYIHFPQFCGADLRVYRQERPPAPEINSSSSGDDESDEDNFDEDGRNTPPVKKRRMEKRSSLKQVHRKGSGYPRSGRLGAKQSDTDDTEFENTPSDLSTAPGSRSLTATPEIRDAEDDSLPVRQTRSRSSRRALYQNGLSNDLERALRRITRQKMEEKMNERDGSLASDSERDDSSVAGSNHNHNNNSACVVDEQNELEPVCKVESHRPRSRLSRSLRKNRNGSRKVNGGHKTGISAVKNSVNNDAKNDSQDEEVNGSGEGDQSDNSSDDGTSAIGSLNCLGDGGESGSEVKEPSVNEDSPKPKDVNIDLPPSSTQSSIKTEIIGPASNDHEGETKFPDENLDKVESSHLEECEKETVDAGCERDVSEREAGRNISDSKEQSEHKSSSPADDSNNEDRKESESDDAIKSEKAPVKEAVISSVVKKEPDERESEADLVDIAEIKKEVTDDSMDGSASVMKEERQAVVSEGDETKSEVKKEEPVSVKMDCNEKNDTDSDEEIEPEIGTFELVADSVADLRILVESFAEPPALVNTRGKKTKSRFPRRKPCVIDLHGRLAYLLTELEPWESKLIQARRRAQVKMRKELDDFCEEEWKKQEADMWNTEDSSSSSDEGGEEDKPTDGTADSEPKLKRSNIIGAISNDSQDSISVANEEYEPDVSSRGRLRKRRVIPNNVEDQGVKKKKVSKPGDEVQGPPHLPAILQKQQKPGAAPSFASISLLTSSASGQNLSASQILKMSSVLNQNFTSTVLTTSLAGSKPTSLISGSVTQSSHPVIQSLLSSRQRLPVPLQPKQSPAQTGTYLQSSAPASHDEIGSNTQKILNSLPASVLQQLLKHKAIKIQTTGPGGTTLFLTSAVPTNVSQPQTTASTFQPPAQTQQTKSVTADNIVPVSGVSANLTAAAKVSAGQTAILGTSKSILTLPVASKPQISSSIPKNIVGGKLIPSGLVLRTSGLSTMPTTAVSTRTVPATVAHTVLSSSVSRPLLSSPPIQQPPVATAITSPVSLYPQIVQQKVLTPGVPIAPINTPSAQARMQSPTKQLLVGGVPPGTPKHYLVCQPNPSSIGTSGNGSTNGAPSVHPISVTTISPSKQKCSYASNVTVKALLENRASQKNSDNQNTIQRSDSFADLKIADNLSTETSPPSSGVSLRKVVVPASRDFKTRVLKLPSQETLDTVLQSVVTSVNTSLPTANIKVPSAVTLPSLQPRRNVTKTIQSMKAPIPAAPPVESSSSAVSMIATTALSTGVSVTNPLSTVAVMSSTKPEYVVQSPAAPAISSNKNMLLKVVPQNFLTSQGLVQGYLTPQGLVIPQNKLSGGSPTQDSLTHSGAPLMNIVQGSAHNTAKGSAIQPVVPGKPATTGQAAVTQSAKTIQLSFSPVKPSTGTLKTLPPAPKTQPVVSTVSVPTKQTKIYSNPVSAQPQSASMVLNNVLVSPKVATPAAELVKQLAAGQSATTNVSGKMLSAGTAGISSSSTMTAQQQQLASVIPALMVGQPAVASVPGQPRLLIPAQQLIGTGLQVGKTVPLTPEAPVRPQLQTPTMPFMLSFGSGLQNMILSPTKESPSQAASQVQDKAIISPPVNVTQSPTAVSNLPAHQVPAQAVQLNQHLKKLSPKPLSNITLSQMTSHQAATVPKKVPFSPQNVSGPNINASLKMAVKQPVTPTVSGQIRPAQLMPQKVNTMSVVGSGIQDAKSSLLLQQVLPAGATQGQVIQIGQQHLLISKPVLQQQSKLSTTPVTTPSAANVIGSSVPLQHPLGIQIPASPITPLSSPTLMQPALATNKGFVQAAQASTKAALQAHLIHTKNGPSPQTVAHPVTPTLSTILGHEKLNIHNIPKSLGSSANVGSVKSVAPGQKVDLQPSALPVAQLNSPSTNTTRLGSKPEITSPVPGVPATPDAKSAQQQKLFLYNVGGQLMTAQGVPVTVDQGVLKVLPQATIQLGSQTLTIKSPSSESSGSVKSDSVQNVSSRFAIPDPSLKSTSHDIAKTPGVPQNIGVSVLSQKSAASVQGSESQVVNTSIDVTDAKVDKPEAVTNSICMSHVSVPSEKVVTELKCQDSIGQASADSLGGASASSDTPRPVLEKVGSREEAALNLLSLANMAER